MCSLATFLPPPPRHYVTVCERNAELVAVIASDINVVTSFTQVERASLGDCSGLLKVFRKSAELKWSYPRVSDNFDVIQLVWYLISEKLNFTKKQPIWGDQF